MPRVSVVVPIHDVESYVATCLQSLARQRYRDLEVVMVDDGSADRSAAIAARFVARDPRFRLLSQPNGGLGRARNTGAAAATGEFLAFVDSDDVLPVDALERLVQSLDGSGSDFATGNVPRLTRQGTSQAQFLARTFARTRMATHLMRFRPLLADRTAWNKLWRRSFWDAHALRFPEGVVHEDIPVTLPAHLAAARVDVLSAPVYQWRLREDGALSITQRRLELKVLRDRLAAVEAVREHFAPHRRLHGWYDQSLLADDLRLHLDLLGEACDEYREVFLAGAQRVLADVPRVHGVNALDRRKWELVRRGSVDELLALLRCERRAPLRRRGRYYGDYPGRPCRLGRRDPELALTVRLEALEARDGLVHLRGRAEVAGRAPEHARLFALPPGRPQPLHLHLVPTRLAGGGFEAVLDPASLGADARLYAHARRGLLHRRRGRFELASQDLVGAHDIGPGARVLVSADGVVRLEARTCWARLVRARAGRGDALELSIDTHARMPEGTLLRLRRRSDGRELSFPFSPLVRVPLADLRAAPPSLEAWASRTDGSDEMWDAWAGDLPLRMAERLAGPMWSGSGHNLALTRTRTGDAALTTRYVPSPLPARSATKAVA